MIAVFAASALLVVLCTLVHYEALRLLAIFLPRMRIAPRARLMVALLGTYAAHSLEIVLYGAAYWTLVHGFGVGELGPAPGPTIGDAMYFSAVAYTSLGFGDVVPHGHLRHFAGVEALNGLLLIGWTATYLYVSMERYWVDEAGRVPPRSDA